MKITGLETIDHAPQVVAEWLNFLQDALGWNERGRAYMLLRETLHALRDYLTVAEAADLGAQLPVLIRGIYYEGWVPGHTPVHPRSREDFLTRVGGAFKVTPLYEPELAVAAVFDLLRIKTSQGEIDQVTRALRKSLRDLWH
ncbi:DUF2267 domain-containing protein [Pontitalea aquivivens]|uniref:DUF2267 domain-containing protein n=1 Tax=Pontitalea aquivivens TaxID=3388663 RepID=UPI003970483B